MCGRRKKIAKSFITIACKAESSPLKLLSTLGTADPDIDDEYYDIELLSVIEDLICEEDIKILKEMCPIDSNIEVLFMLLTLLPLFFVYGHVVVTKMRKFNFPAINIKDVFKIFYQFLNGNEPIKMPRIDVSTLKG